MPGFLGHLFNGVAHGVSVLAGVTLVALVVLVVAEIIARSVFNTSLAVVEECVGYFVVLLMVLGAAMALRRRVPVMTLKDRCRSGVIWTPTSGPKPRKRRSFL